MLRSMARLATVLSHIESRLVACWIKRWLFFLSTTAVAASQAAVPNPVLLEHSRDVTVDDAIEMVRPASQNYFVGADIGHSIAQFSPDKKQFLVVLRKGILSDSSNEYTVYLFRTDAAFRSPIPRVIARLRSMSNVPAIQAVQWGADSRQIYFLGCNQSQRTQVYSVVVQEGRLVRLTAHTTSIRAYGLSRNGRLFFLADSRKHQKPFFAEKPLGTAITDQSLVTLLNYAKRVEEQDPELFVINHRAERQIAFPLNFHADGVWPSPEGDRVIVSSNMEAGELHREWERYRFPGGAWARSMFHSRFPSQRTPFIRYIAIDVESGRYRSVWSGAHWSSSPVAWSSAGNWIYLKQMYIPLDEVSTISQAERLKTAFDIRVDIPSRRWEIVAPGDWPSEKVIGPPLDIELRQDLNTPPRLFARNAKSGQDAELMDLNPQLRTLRIGHVEAVSWTVHRVKVKAGLYFPPDYAPGKRYPLVIQTHGFNENRFSMDGMNEWSSSFAARPLAAKGILVLQAYSFADAESHDTVANDRSLGGTEQESFRTFAKLVYESAIDELDRRGLILPEKVGISGFSRTVWFVAYALTHTDRRFAAAVLTDGIDAGYFQYMSFRQAEFDLDNGSMPFGEEGIEQWGKESPGFNLDKVHTPVRLVSLDTSMGILEAWEWFTGLTMLKKPVDLVVIPEGVHLLETPHDRAVAMNGVVDWFQFWLQGEEDPSKEKTGQYTRWHVLKSADKSQLISENSQD
jgi:hypothetical protein